MSNRDKTKPLVFDLARMRADVLAYRMRHNLSFQQFLDLADITVCSHARQQLMYDILPSLETVVKWAKVCDLSLDSYILPFAYEYHYSSNPEESPKKPDEEQGI